MGLFSVDSRSQPFTETWDTTKSRPRHQPGFVSPRQNMTSHLNKLKYVVFGLWFYSVKINATGILGNECKGLLSRVWGASWLWWMGRGWEHVFWFVQSLSVKHPPPLAALSSHHPSCLLCSVYLLLTAQMAASKAPHIFYLHLLLVTTWRELLQYALAILWFPKKVKY